MRTSKEFNQRYELILDGPGLVIDIPAVVYYLDQWFDDLLKIEGFRCKEISTVRGLPRVDTNLEELMPFVGRIINQEIQEKLSLILKVEFEVEQRLASLNLDKHGKPTNYE